MTSKLEYILVACVFYDEKWTGESELSRTYMIRVEKPPPNLDYFRFELQMSGAEGHCEPTRNAQKDLVKNDFTCLTWLKDSCTVVAMWNTTNEGFLLTKSRGGRSIIKKGLPTTINFQDDGKEYAVRATTINFKDDGKEYAVSHPF